MNSIIFSAVISFIINTVGDYILKKLKINNSTERRALKSRLRYINNSTFNHSINSNYNNQSVDNNNFNNNGNVHIKNTNTQINNYTNVSTQRDYIDSNSSTTITMLIIAFIVCLFVITIHFKLKELIELDPTIIVLTGFSCALHRIIFSKFLSRNSSIYLYKDRYDLYMIMFIGITILLSSNLFMPDKYIHEYSIILDALNNGATLNFSLYNTLNISLIFIVYCCIRSLIHLIIPFIPLIDMIYYLIHKRSILINMIPHLFLSILGLLITIALILPNLLY